MAKYFLHSKRILSLGACLLFLPLPGFSREFSVLTYNLKRFAQRDHASKPDEECRAMAHIIAKADPDILAVQEIGDASFMEEFQGWLRTEGLEYPHTELLQRGDRQMNLAVFSRFPIIETTHHTNEWYSIGKAKLTVARGFLETKIKIKDDYQFHLLNAHLKSKVYSRLGQTEMRRNEARLLNKVVRRIMIENPGCKLLVVGDMNDNPNSAAIREVKGKSKKNLIDLRPVEPSGDAWTYYMEKTEQHMRFDYILANKAMIRDVISEKSTVIRTPSSYIASDHRPVKGVFQTLETH